MSRCAVGHGDEDQLPLAHRQLAHVAMPETRDADALDRTVDRADVAGTEPGERRFVRQAAKCHDLLDRHREGQVGELGHDRDGTGQCRTRRPLDRLAEQLHGACPRCEDAGDRPQER